MLLLGALLIAVSFPLSTYADQIAITNLPLYSRATDDVQLCVYTQQSDYIGSYGCTVTNPAGCLCSDASSSYRVASAISNCINEVIDWSMGRSEFITATQIFASYCLTNAGVSARDETLLQDIPLYTRGGFDIANCALSLSSAYSTSLGCDFNTPAVCLCGESSSVIQSAMLSCASQEILYSPQFVASTITELWSSYCSVNIATTATRTIEAIVTQPGSAATGAASSAVPSATASTPMNTATGTQSGSSASTTPGNPGTGSSGSSSSGSSSSESSSSGSGLSVGAEVGLAVGCAFGAALLTMMATWWKPRQLGRFFTCGAWPAKQVDDHTARAQMTHIFTGPRRPAPASHVYA
ncbi:hypothetical protein MMC11_004882 [Xylographa trunciseda]|nr:hypothetical protein [Xylographa trunciseda]